jgi:hypothetical protein
VKPRTSKTGTNGIGPNGDGSVKQTKSSAVPPHAGLDTTGPVVVKRRKLRSWSSVRAIDPKRAVTLIEGGLLCSRFKALPAMCRADVRKGLIASPQMRSSLHNRRPHFCAGVDFRARWINDHEASRT